MLPFHLCQPGEGASCGACCGLYNFRDHSREAVQATLHRQTDLIARTEKTPAAFGAAARELKAKQPAPAFPDVRVCPLLGFLDEPRTRVGCLAHPLVTGGPDLRDCGAYTSSICQSFECPSFLWLTGAQARLIRAACPDWYLYGLIVTDVELVRGVLRLLSNALGQEADPDRVVERPAALRAAHQLFALKEQATGRDQSGVFGRFAPTHSGEPGLRQLDYGGLGATAAPEDDVVLCLGFTPQTLEALESSRSTVREAILAVALALNSK